jgi:hypothetical protein
MPTKTTKAPKAGTTAKPKITALELTLPGLAAVSLIPAGVRADAQNYIDQANALTTIESREALITADTLASRMSAHKSEIKEGTDLLLKPYKVALDAATKGVGAIVDSLDEARVALAERVLAARAAFGITDTEGWACYASTIDDLKIVELAKVPHTVKIPDGQGGFTTLEILKVDAAAVKKALKHGVAVPGVYMASKQSIGVRSK